MPLVCILRSWRGGLVASDGEARARQHTARPRRAATREGVFTIAPALRKNIGSEKFDSHRSGLTTAAAIITEN